MSRLRIQLLAATALIAAALFTGGAAAMASTAARPHVPAHVLAGPRSIGATDWGDGATAAAAQQAATQALHGDYFGCEEVYLVSDTDNGDGTWTAEVSSVCRGYN
jgi:hypothetical protein